MQLLVNTVPTAIQQTVRISQSHAQTGHLIMACCVLFWSFHLKTRGDTKFSYLRLKSSTPTFATIIHFISKERKTVHFLVQCRQSVWQFRSYKLRYIPFQASDCCVCVCVVSFFLKNTLIMFRGSRGYLKGCRRKCHNPIKNTQTSLPRSYVLPYLYTYPWQLWPLLSIIFKFWKNRIKNYQ